MANNKGDNQKTLQNLGLLFGSIIAQGDTKQSLVFLDRYFVYLKQLPEFSEITDKYKNEELDSLKGMENLNQLLSTQVNSEVARIFSKDLIDLERINTTMSTDWEGQRDDVPQDGETLVSYYTELSKSGGITRYLKLKELIDYVEARQDDIFSFICGLHDLEIGRECQSSFEEWMKKYNELNPDGQIWWAYKKISDEKSKAFKEINFTKLREYLNAFHEDVKQLLVFGNNSPAKIEKKLVLSKDVSGVDTNTGGYLVTFPNNKKLNFTDKEEDICKAFRYYLNRYGELVDNNDVVDYIHNLKRPFNDMMTTLLEKIRDNSLGKTISLKGSRRGSYKLEINL